MPDDKAALDALNGVAAVAQAALNTEPQPARIAIAYVEDSDDSQLIWRNRTPYVPSIWPPYGEAVAFLCAFDDSSATKMVQATKPGRRTKRARLPSASTSATTTSGCPR